MTPDLWVPTPCDKCGAMIFDQYESLPNIEGPGDVWCLSCVDVLMADKGWTVVEDDEETEIA